ncbi:hypothetical protein H6G97_01060 [Nostoc flagelliforme FACHB-838]|uniref:Uncharacterized protein n=1 Tax=Nostoc flagelliforme FACHB-838 TaxID=2692904 RepID=A0ABR8DH98_9NOSO|nr:hypothetical protein [Nostoc flagelliforme FACHB-838]
MSFKAGVSQKIYHLCEDGSRDEGAEGAGEAGGERKLMPNAQCPLS